MNVFAVAMDILAADPNLGTAAIYRAGGSGPELALRVVRSSPDRIGDAFGTALVQATDMLAVAIAALPGLSAGDSFAIGPDLLTVTHAERDATGTAWRVLCQR